MAPTLAGSFAAVAATSTGVASVAVDLAAGGFDSPAGSIPTLVARIALNNSGTAGAAVGLTVSDARNGPGAWNVLTAVNYNPGGSANTGMTSYLAFVEAKVGYQNGDDVTFRVLAGLHRLRDRHRSVDRPRRDPVGIRGRDRDRDERRAVHRITPGGTNHLVYGLLAIKGGGTDPTPKTPTRHAVRGYRSTRPTGDSRPRTASRSRAPTRL